MSEVYDKAVFGNQTFEFISGREKLTANPKFIAVLTAQYGDFGLPLLKSYYGWSACFEVF